MPFTFLFSEINAMSYVRRSTESSRKESIQIMRELRKTEKNINELLTQTSPEKPPLLPEDRPVYYLSLRLQITSSIRIEINQFPTKNVVIMKVLIPHFRTNRFVSVREAAFPCVRLKVGEREPLSGIFIKKDLEFDSQTDIENEECSESIAKSFGCDWYDTKRKCISPFEFDNLFSYQSFPRSSSLHYNHRSRKN